MRSHLAALLLAAACASPASAAVRWEMFNRRVSDQRLSNTTVTPPAGNVPHPSSSTSFVAFDTSSSSSISHGSQTSSNSIQGSVTNGESAASSGPAPTSLASQLSTPNTRIAASTSTIASLPESNPGVSANSVNNPPSTPNPTTTSKTIISSHHDSSTTPLPTHSAPSSQALWNTTRQVGTLTEPALTSAITTCTNLQDVETVTEFSIVYTTTTTLYGNYSTYTPPYPTIVTPNYCGMESTVPTDFTLSFNPMHTTFSEGFVVSTKKPAASCSIEAADSECWEPAGPGMSTETETYRGKHPAETQSASQVTVTFVTTDKNPAVVSATETAPDYNESGQAESLTVQQHKSAQADGGGNGGGDGDGDSNDPQSQQVPKTTTATVTTVTASFTVTARAGQVIINDKTFSNLEPDQTTTVTFSEGIFTIFPSSVVGEGATVTKPQPVVGVVGVATPTTTSAGDLAVEVSGSVAIVDGSTIEILPQGTTTVVNSEQVSVGPGRVVVGDETVTFRAAGVPETAIVVQGGEMVTAIGQSVFVFHSTTLTYGPGIPETSEVVDDDTITIGPTGVILHGTTIGGPLADVTETTYEIVGGATFTKVAPSYIVVDGTTFTAGPGSKRTTKVIGGETITAGPNGVVISSVTWSIPFGSSAVTTITATHTGSRMFPEETGTSGDDDSSNDGQSHGDSDSAGSVWKPGAAAGMAGLHMAIGVWIWL